MNAFAASSVRHVSALMEAVVVAAAVCDTFLSGLTLPERKVNTKYECQKKKQFAFLITWG